MLAAGTFEVKLDPLESALPGGDGIALNRMAIKKEFSGDLVAASSGEMLSANTPVADSAGYVALERVDGRLQGRSGSFVLQHFGVMHGGQNRLVLEVVPDSGTGELVGLTGSMSLEVTDGSHSYEFVYSID